MYRHILIPTDGSVVSARAEKAAIEVAKRFGARVTIAHVVAPWSRRATGTGIRSKGTQQPTAEGYRDATEKRGNAVLEKVERRARRAGLKVGVVLLTSDSPGSALVELAAAKRCDLVVLGSNSRTGIERIFLGSVASDVVKGSKSAILVCR